MMDLIDNIIAQFRTMGFLSHDDIYDLISAYERLHAHLHHFYKYHAAKQDAERYGVPLGQETWYLGTSCGGDGDSPDTNCEFSNSQRRAVEEFKDSKVWKADV